MGHSISLPIGSLPGVRHARDPSNCGRRAFGTTPRWCLAERQSLPRRRLCDPVDDRFRRALLARRLRVSDAPATVPSRSDFQQPGIRCRKQFLVHGAGMYARMPPHSISSPLRPHQSTIGPRYPQNGGGLLDVRRRGHQITSCPACSLHLLTIRARRRLTDRLCVTPIRRSNLNIATSRWMPGAFGTSCLSRFVARPPSPPARSPGAGRSGDW
jgi:hypothetical protein